MAFQIVDDVLDLREGRANSVSLPVKTWRWGQSPCQRSSMPRGDRRLRAATRLDAGRVGETVEPSEVDRVVEDPWLRRTGSGHGRSHRVRRPVENARARPRPIPRLATCLSRSPTSYANGPRSGIRILTLPRGQSRTSGQKCCASSVRVGQPSPGRPRAAPACRASSGSLPTFAPAGSRGTVQQLRFMKLARFATFNDEQICAQHPGPG